VAISIEVFFLVTVIANLFGFIHNYTPDVKIQTHIFLCSGHQVTNYSPFFSSRNNLLHQELDTMVSKHARAAILLLSVSAFILFMETKQTNRVIGIIHGTNEFNQLSISGGESRDTKRQHTPAQHNHITIDQIEKRPFPYNGSIHEEETVISFENASSFISILRDAFDSKQSLQRSPNSTLSDCSKRELRTRDLHIFHRAIDANWVGRDLPAVMGSSVSSGPSCNFVGAELRPTEMTLHHQLKRRVYDTVLHTAGQCTNAFQWERVKSTTCLGNNFGGTLGAGTKEECISGSVGAILARDWLTRNSKKATNCLNSFLHGNLVGIIFANQTSSDSKILEEIAEHTSLSLYQNIHLLVDGEIGSDGYFREREWQKHWNDEMFVKWANAVLMETIRNQTSSNIVTLLVHTISFISEALSGAWKLGVKQNETTWLWCTCVGKLALPALSPESIEERKKLWQMKGLRLSSSSMAETQSALMRSFTGSLGGVLPPSPNAVYARNAVVERVS